MAKANRSRRLRKTARHGVTTAVLVLLPLLALGGALMPGMVEVVEEKTAGASQEVQRHFEPLPVPRRPLLIPRDFSAGFVPDLINSAQLFGGASPHELLVDGLAGISAVAARQADLIILDDIEEFVRNVLFEDVLDDAAITDDPNRGLDEELFALIPSTIGIDTVHQYDDFGGQAATPIPVPEPSTALLLAMGLGGLAWFGKRNRA